MPLDKAQREVSWSQGG